MRSNGDRAVVRGGISIPELLVPLGSPPRALANVAPNRFVLIGELVEFKQEWLCLTNQLPPPPALGRRQYEF